MNRCGIDNILPADRNHPAYRLLKGYTIDPSFSSRLDSFLINQTVYKVEWERNLAPGPRGEYLDIVDVDPMSNCVYQPISLNEEEILSRNGLTPSESNPQFHQQFVYTISMLTVQNFERALGRKVIWREHFDQRRKDNDERYVQRLRIHPHAFEDANAYYTPDKKAILYGYFKAVDEQQGTVLPGGTIFTCLSPDIIAHETTHAILDSIHPTFIEPTNPDVGAFHEAFADIVALLQRFSIRELVKHQLRSSRGSLDGANIFGKLATQFGQALGYGHNSLRTAIGYLDENKVWQQKDPNRTDIETINSPHERGSILVAAIFRAFVHLYKKRTEDLFVIAGVNPDANPFISTELIERLTDEAVELADHLLDVCIQALDFLPPVDITFGNYLRALITADTEMAPIDKLGFRVALIEAFSSWGIYPQGVSNLSEESLVWDRAKDLLDKTELCMIDTVIEKLDQQVYQLGGIQDREEIFKAYKNARLRIYELLVRDEGKMNGTSIYDNKEIWNKFLNKLGIRGTVKELNYDGEKITWLKDSPNPQIHSIRTVNRTSREGMRKQQLIITIIQTLRIRDEENPLNGLKFRGGCTLIIDLSDNKNSEYVIYKNINSNDRLKRQLDYQLGVDGKNELLLNSPYNIESFDLLDFRLLHDH